MFQQGYLFYMLIQSRKLHCTQNVRDDFQNGAQRAKTFTATKVPRIMANKNRLFLKFERNFN